jgi:hypothetical protein
MIRRTFLAKVICATGALLTGLGLTWATTPLNQSGSITRLYRWDGRLDARPSVIIWFDMVPGDIVSPDGKEFWQIEDLPRFSDGVESVKISKEWAWHQLAR